MLDLSEKYNGLKNNGRIEQELFKSLLRFSFAERLLPEKGKLNSLSKYYEELKVRVGWLKFNPHFCATIWNGSDELWSARKSHNLIYRKHMFLLIAGKITTPHIWIRSKQDYIFFNHMKKMMER